MGSKIVLQSNKKKMTFKILDVVKAKSPFIENHVFITEGEVGIVAGYARGIGYRVRFKLCKQFVFVDESKLEKVYI